MLNFFKKIKDMIFRNSVWLLIGLTGIFLLGPSSSEINTILLVMIFEGLALGLSGLALYAYSKIDFTTQGNSPNPGMIFLGVHILCGLTIIGVYLAQFPF